ncbi:hypothetical protein BO70DRAFT_376527 [Aspergillus heteromorphus CBS 117.55]|uniref:CNH domain-containing protein n=1 Tax=Aspergillus heteromorphus CBS 117.55 TaxID=1448321 RepID=A0A317WX94_9EURO|nr:uncharacterized protein BO70DRAFT_376527 [Aspergillus heteromorphus CBS 117.55]PWY90645.1 hypothetical protein BO70DRAFT_376527 [Aspergillus heteromorphus CBS 117.55]
MLSAFTARPLVELKPRDKSRIESVLAYGDRVLVGLNNGNLRVYRVNEDEEGDHTTGQGQGGRNGGVNGNNDENSGRGNGNGQNNGNGKGNDAPSHSHPEQEQDTNTPATATATATTTATTGTGATAAGGAVFNKPSLLREIERFSRYKIDQLSLIKEAKLLVSLSGGYVSIHDLTSYTLQTQLTRTKGASTFAVTSNIENDSETGMPTIVSRLAVAVKRKILVWVWRDMELVGDEVLEVSLVSGVKSLRWVSGTKIVVGLGSGSGFVLVDLEGGTKEGGKGANGVSVMELVGGAGMGGQDATTGAGRLAGVGVASMGYIGIGGSASRPLATRLREGQVLLAKDIHTHFIDTQGNSLGRRQIPWSHAPADIGYSYPFLLALHDASKGVLEVRNPETLSLLQSVPLPAASILHIPQPTISLAHAGKGFLVASDRTIWRMEALSYDTQIDSLVEKGYLDEAISLAGMLEDALLRDKWGRLRQIKLEKAEGLFGLRKYTDAMDLFTEISAPPETVIRLYPRIVAGEQSAVVETEESEDGTEDSHKTQDQTDGSAEETAPPKTLTHAPSVMSLLRNRTDDASDAGSIRGRLEEARPDKALEGNDLKLAVRELQRYLADVRRRFQRFLNPDGTLKTIDATTDGANDELTDSVMKLLSITTPTKDTPHDLLGERLREKAKLVDTTLFRAYMYAIPALAGSLFRIANFCDPDVVMEKLEETGRHNDLIDFLYGKKLHRQALELLRKFGQAADEEDTAPQLHGPKRTVGYLQNLSPERIDLILEFAEWPVTEDPDLGMEIFLADTENAETLPRDRVLGFLLGVDVNLAVRYLEHVIGELNDLSPDLHQKLLMLYLDRLEKRNSHDWAFKTEDEHVDWRDRFLDPEFFEARAIVFSKMGQHRQALEIYVFRLEDYAKAEERHRRRHPPRCVALLAYEEDKPSIYLTLLSLYLSPPHGYQPRYGPALEVLAKHGSRLPPNSALDLIPETLPVQELDFYFRGRMRAANSILNESRIVSSLQKAENIKTQAQLLVGEATDGRGTRSRHVTITEERVCGMCHKRIGGSVINVFPE